MCHAECKNVNICLDFTAGSQRQEYHHSNDSLISVDEGVSLRSNTGSRERRRRLYDQTSSSEHSFDGSEVNTRRPRRISDSAVGQKSRRQKMICSYSLSDHEEEDKMMVQDSVQRSLRQRIDKRTGTITGTLNVALFWTYNG